MSPGYGERRPCEEAAPETPTRSVPKGSALDDLDALHHAWLVGYETGLAHGQRMAAENLAQELLSHRAAEMAGVAVTTAHQRHGDGWATSIRDAAEVDR